MNTLLSILRATHCRNTHHHFAVDALELVQTEPGQRLTSQLLRHHDRYLAGAKDPDTRFRDFQNHVIHVTDGYWGGAPRVAHIWYDKLQRYLRTDRFGDAAHAAGVLSHYFTDPLQPLHTQQCAKERILHRPIEWSILKSYRRIYRIWKEDDLRIVFQLSGGPLWLGEAILHGARFANRKYQSLIDGYDFDRAAKDPTAGLTDTLQESLAELVGLSITGLARVLERAAADAESTRNSPIPIAGRMVPTLLSTVRMPITLWIRHWEHKREQRAIERLIDEFRTTGNLVERLPVEVDIVHRVTRVYHDEKRWQRERAERLASRETKIEVIAGPTEQADSDPPAVILPFERHAPAGQTPAAASGNLSRLDPIIQAPSIGQKLAARFEAIEIRTVGQLLESNVDDVARRLATYWITRETISQWQHQSTLMCQIAGLSSRDAQILAGAGFRSAQEVAVAKEKSILRRVKEYASTTSGRRHLRGAEPPTAEDVRCWHQNSATSISSVSRRQSA